MPPSIHETGGTAGGELSFAAFERWCTDPAARAEHDRETQAWRDDANALIDRGLAALNDKQARRWDEEARHG